jgi:hypothetical protein
MTKSDQEKVDDPIPTSTNDVKSRILDRISKEVEKSSAKGNGNEFQVITGDPSVGESPVKDTYYKGGSYVKTS